MASSVHNSVFMESELQWGSQDLCFSTIKNLACQVLIRLANWGAILNQTCVHENPYAAGPVNQPSQDERATDVIRHSI